MKTHLLQGLVVTATIAIAGCTSDSRASLKSDAQSAASQVGNAVDQTVRDAAETLVRNIATQQGEEQFKNAGQELAGPLTCDAKVNDGIAKVDVTCTGTTKAGGAASLTGTTSELPGASVVSLDGQFTGTVDGNEVFSTQRLGG